MTHSVVETVAVDSGRTRVLLEADFRLESPNWSPDGQTIYVNGGGRLYALTIGQPGLRLIFGDAVVRVANDHGLSRDGRVMAMTARVHDDQTGRDRTGIFVIRQPGQTPVLVTRSEPSWFHGFSPDGRQLVYACVRRGAFAIATCPVAGGEETILITDPEPLGVHYDAPEFTADGAHVWFNADRGGPMALWRMRADGSDPEQMTDGALPDWFPHPSPDGRHVCFLSYQKGTLGHPPDRPVSLRVMPATGGAPRTLVTFRGGEGSLNSPNWSPDGSAIAYVRHEEAAA